MLTVTKQTISKLLSWFEFFLAITIILAVSFLAGSVFVGVTYFSIVDPHASWRSVAAVTSNEVDWSLAISKVKNLTSKVSAYQITLNQFRLPVDTN